MTPRLPTRRRQEALNPGRIRPRVPHGAGAAGARGPPIARVARGRTGKVERGQVRKRLSEVAGAIWKSRLFKEESEVDVLGKRRPVIGFRHELIGKFLASRHHP